MNIAINTRLLLPHGYKEGISRYIYEISKRLVKNHPEHQFYFFFDRAYSEEYIFANNVTPVVISPPARHPILFYIWYDWCVPYYLKKHKIDVFFSPDNFLSLRTDVPQLLTVHDVVYHHLPVTIPFAPRKYYQYFMPRYIAKADHIVTVSNAVKDDVFLVSPTLPRSNVTTVYNALPSTFENLSAADKKIDADYFIVVGSINPRKNTERILLAFEQFSKEHPSVKLVIIGSSMWKKASMPVWDRMHDLGRLIHIQGATDIEVVGYVQHAKALIFASLHEGFGFPILEGFACGTPVITSNNSSMREIGGNACLYVDPYDVNDIASKMKEIYNNSDLSSNLLNIGRSAFSKYSWDESAVKIGQILISLKK